METVIFIMRKAYATKRMSDTDVFNGACDVIVSFQKEGDEGAAPHPLAFHILLASDKSTKLGLTDEGGVIKARLTFVIPDLPHLNFVLHETRTFLTRIL